MSHVHVPGRTYRALAARAARERVSTNTLVARLLAEQIDPDADLPARSAPEPGDLDVDDCGWPSPNSTPHVTSHAA